VHDADTGADAVSGASALGTGRRGRRGRTAPHWSVQVLLVFVIGRAVSTAVLLPAAARQGVSPWSGAAPGYGTFVNFWDSGWYERIFREGYPAELPRNASGVVTHNQWAFYPLFPGVVRVLDAVTGAGWGVLAPAVALGAAAGASMVVYRLFRVTAAHRTALLGVAVVSLAPVAVILQVPYAEALHLLLLASALLLVSTHRYYAAMPVVVLMCLTRPAGVPFALMIGVLFVRTLWAARRGSDERRAVAVRRLPALLLLGIVSAAAAVSWPLIAWAVTGERDAYVATETAWRGEPLAPFMPWFEGPAGLIGPAAAVLGIVILLLAVGGVFLAPSVRALGPVPLAWCGAYLFYLAAFWDPQSSTWRILLPLFPLALAVAGLRRGRLLWVVLPASVLLQAVWVEWLWGWTPTGPDGDQPP
jgi:hypothetical protein